MIPFLDLAADFAEVEGEARRRIDGVLARQVFVLGPETADLEEAMRERTGAASAVAVSSGSDALSLALLALGIGPGDAVVVPSFTFFASAGAVVRAGATPVFCDLDPATFLAGAPQMEAAIERGFAREGGVLRHRGSGARLAALMPVHLYGRAVDMEAVVELAVRVGARVVEDAAQAVGCVRGGVHVGLFGDAGCLSFYPTKNLGGAGDGGMLLTRDAVLGERLSRLRTHGGEHGSYEHHEVGVNARMAELVASVLNAKLPRLEAWTRRRVELAALYDDALAGAVARGLLELPSRAPRGEHVFHQYAVRVPAATRGAEAPGRARARRDAVLARLATRSVQARVFYPLPLHLQPCFRTVGAHGATLPGAEAAAAEVACLPIHPSMRDEDAEAVASALVEAVEAEAS